jgi:hypothetical protein
MSGEVINEPKKFFNLLIHNQIGGFYTFLYSLKLNISWFGIITFGFAVTAILLINFILFYIVSPQNRYHYLIYLCLSTAFYLAFLVESILLLSYSKIALLLSFSSFLCMVILYHYKLAIKHKRLFYLLLFVAFYFGLSTRPALIILFLPIASFFCISTLPKIKFIKINFYLIVFVLLYSSFSWLILSRENKEIVRNMYPAESYIISLIDGFNLSYDYENERDSIKIACLKSWYFADSDTLLNTSFLEEIGGKSTFNKVSLLKWKNNLNSEYQKARYNYNENYLPELNWWWKTITIVILILFLPLLFYLIKSISARQFFGYYFYIIGSFAFLIIITILFKMEDRVLNPLLIFILLSILLCIRDFRIDLKSKLLVAIIISWGCIGFYRLSDYKNISAQRKIELEMKEKIQRELKHNFFGRYLVFDLYTITMLESSPFHFYNYPDNWISGVEVWNYNLPNQSYLDDIALTTDFPVLFTEIAKRQHQFVFFYKSERIQLTEDYNSIIYGIDVHFKKLSTNFLINDFHYSLHWIPFDYGYYELDYISKKENCN